MKYYSINLTKYVPYIQIYINMDIYQKQNSSEKIRENVTKFSDIYVYELENSLLRYQFFST